MPLKRKRIYGVEVEYGSMPGNLFEIPGRQLLLFEYSPVTAAMKNYVFSASAPRSLFLTNEGRLYIDTGNHAEYATPEATNPRDAVIWEKSGERILETIARAINKHLGAESYKEIGGVTFIKNNQAPESDKSWGYHQNFLVSRDVNVGTLNWALMPFIATAHIWNGNGLMVADSAGRFRFYLSQRAGFTTAIASFGTTQSRGLISNKDEPLADVSKYRRLHVIGNDSHMSELISYLDLSLIGLIVQMVEDGFMDGSGFSWIFGVGEGQLTNARRLANDDLKFEKVFPLGAKALSALDVQKLYLEIFRKYEKDRGFAPPEADAVDRFESLLGKFDLAAGSEEPETFLYQECDWAAKLMLQKADASKKGYWLDGSNFAAAGAASRSGQDGKRMAKSRLGLIDLRFHDVRRDIGWHYKLENSGLRTRLLQDSEVAFAINNPPPDTRAHLRRLYQDAMARNNYSVCSWDWSIISAYLDKDSSRQIAFSKALPDPFKFSL